MRNTEIWNTEKGRKATPNEVAKYLIVDQIEMLCAIQEKYGCENLTDEEAKEVARFYEKHLSAIRKKLDTNKYRWK